MKKIENYVMLIAAHNQIFRVSYWFIKNHKQNFHKDCGVGYKYVLKTLTRTHQQIHANQPTYTQV